jgi:hypothetical protein
MTTRLPIIKAAVGVIPSTLRALLQNTCIVHNVGEMSQIPLLSDTVNFNSVLSCPSFWVCGVFTPMSAHRTGVYVQWGCMSPVSCCYGYRGIFLCHSKHVFIVCVFLFNRRSWRLLRYCFQSSSMPLLFRERPFSISSTSGPCGLVSLPPTYLSCKPCCLGALLPMSIQPRFNLMAEFWISAVPRSTNWKPHLLLV